MTSSAFWALWTHRYRKYSYIFKELLRAILVAGRFLALKMSLGFQKKLVLVVRTEHFGDIVAAEPIARQLRELHPADYLVWIVRPVFGELLERHPDINHVWSQHSVLERLIVCKSGVFNKIYNLEFWQSNVDVVSGYVHQNPVAAQNNVTVHNYFEKGSLLTTFQLAANLPLLDDAPRVYISANDRARVDALRLPSKMVVVHCNSNYPVKDWSLPNWEQLITWLIVEKGYSVAEIGLKSSNKISNAAYFDCCGQLSILETAEVIRRADYFVGIDSGPAHLANAVGTFGFLLFGKLNNFDGYMPYSGAYQNQNNALMINQKGKTCAEMDYDFVQQKMEKFFLEIHPIIKSNEYQ